MIPSECPSVRIRRYPAAFPCGFRDYRHQHLSLDDAEADDRGAQCNRREGLVTEACE